MKTLLYIAGSILVLAAAAFGGYKYRNEIKAAFDSAVPKVKDAVRSTYGKVAHAADNLAHTERDLQNI